MRGHTCLKAGDDYSKVSNKLFEYANENRQERTVHEANDNNFPEIANIIKTMCIANEIKGKFKYIQSVSTLKS